MFHTRKCHDCGLAFFMSHDGTGVLVATVHFPSYLLHKVKSDLLEDVIPATQQDIRFLCVGGKVPCFSCWNHNSPPFERGRYFSLRCISLQPSAFASSRSTENLGKCCICLSITLVWLMNKSVWMDFVEGHPSVCDLQTQNAEDVKLNQIELCESEDYTFIQQSSLPQTRNYFVLRLPIW